MFTNESFPSVQLFILQHLFTLIKISKKRFFFFLLEAFEMIENTNKRNLSKKATRAVIGRKAEQIKTFLVNQIKTLFCCFRVFFLPCKLGC
jgi:hypothetical protein